MRAGYRSGLNSSTKAATGKTQQKDAYFVGNNKASSESSEANQVNHPNQPFVGHKMS